MLIFSNQMILFIYYNTTYMYEETIEHYLKAFTVPLSVFG